MIKSTTTLLIASASLFAATASAAGIDVTIDHSEASMQDQLVLTVTVEGSQSAEPTLPALPDFTVYARGRSTQMQIINGHTSTSVVHNYMLIPKRAGRFIIGAATVNIDGRTYQSKPFAVMVHSTSMQPTEVSRDAYVTASISKTKAYVSEQLVYTWRFYRRVRISDASIDVPEFDGFITEDLGKQRDYETVIQGQRYQVSELRKALFPQEAGTLTVAPSTLSVSVVVQQQRRRGLFGSPFDDFFGRGTTKTQVLRTEPIEVTVSPLPQAPQGFSGLVGQFELTSQVSKHSVAVGESTTLTLTVSGEGNARVIPEPLLGGLSGFKVYDDKPSGAVSAEGARLSGSKSFRKALVPLAPGTLQIPSARLIYFDPSEGIYRTRRTEPVTLSVRPGEGKEELRLTESMAPSTGKVAVKVLAEDIIPIHRKLQAAAIPWIAPRNAPAIVALLGLPPIGFIIAWLFRRRQSQSAVARAERRRKGALKRGLSSAAAVRQHLSSGASALAAETASGVLRQFLGDKLSLPSGGLALTPSEAAQQLESVGINGELSTGVRRLLEHCEAARYGASASAANPPDTLLADQLVKLLKKLDRELRS